MGVSTDLARPENEDDFEAMCHQLYRIMWEDPGCTRVGRPGQDQFGVDILGNDGRRPVGIQCKHYLKTKFTLATVTDDVGKADGAGIDIGHLIFATTAPNNAEVVRDVHALSEARRRAGKFTVSVDFWNNICGHIRMFPQIGRAFIPGYPGSTIVSIQESVTRVVALVEHGNASQADIQRSLDELLKRSLLPEASGKETDSVVAKSLDFIRDKIREGKSSDARELLMNLGAPARLQDSFSRFRWYTNRAAVDLADGLNLDAAKGYLEAFDCAPDQETANCNRVRAYLLLDNLSLASSACSHGLSLFEESATLWSLEIYIRKKSGVADPVAGVPDSAFDSTDVKFMRAEVHHGRGEFEQAVALLRSAADDNPASQDARRSYLAETVGWAAQDGIQAYHNHITTPQREVLNDAVSRFEPLETVLPSIQSEHLSFEITSNVSSALLLLGDKTRARKIVSLSLARHPNSEGLLRIRLNELLDEREYSKIRVLTDTRLAELPPAILALLAEASANQGEIEWHSSVMAVVKQKVHLDGRLKELDTLEFQALAVSGSPAKALDAARKYSEENPKSLLGLVTIVQILVRMGQENLAIAEALKALDYISESSSKADILQAAELLYQYNHFFDASRLYLRLVSYPGADTLTWRLLVCLLKSDQRTQTRRILERLDPAVRTLGKMRRVECDLARRTGDWARMKELLTIDLAENPTSCDVALGYVGALFQLDDTVALDEYLSKDNVFVDSVPENEFEFAKHQISRGFGIAGMRRICSLFRKNPNNAQIAGYVTVLSVLASTLAPIPGCSSVEQETAILLSSSSETWWVAIDYVDAPTSDGWAELIPPTSPLALRLKGLKVGDKVYLTRGFGNQEVEVARIIPLIAFSVAKARDIVMALPTPQGPVWTVSARTDAGLSQLKNLREQQHKHRQIAFSNYEKLGYPTAALAKFIGADPVTLLVDWPYYGAVLRVAMGTDKEFKYAEKTIRSPDRRYVLDLITIAELVRHQCFDSVVQILGRPLIPATVREQALQLLRLEVIPQTAHVKLGKKSAPIGLFNKYSNSHKNLLQSILDAIDQHCEVSVTWGPDVITKPHQEVSTILGDSTMDVLYLCMERDAILITEDLFLRASASEFGIRESLSTQPILIEAKSQGFLSEKLYRNAIGFKTVENHSFVSVSADDLMSFAEAEPKKIAVVARAAINTFRNPACAVHTCYQVCAAFLTMACRKFSSNVIAGYAGLIFDALSTSHPEFSDVIQQGLGNIVQDAYGKGGRRLSKAERKLFGHLIDKSLRQ